MGLSKFFSLKFVSIILFLIVIFPLNLIHSQEPSTPQTIKLVTDIWPPFYGPNLPDNGFFCKIVRSAFKEANYNLSIDFYEWKIAKKLAKTSKFDGLLGAYYKKEREAFFEYSLPVLVVKTIFITRKELDVVYDGNLHNLEEFKIGISSGYTYCREFDRAEFLTKIAVPAPEQLLSDLISKRVDVVAISETVAKSYLNNQFKKDRSLFKALGPSLTTNKLYILISKENPDHQTIISAFNTGLKRLAKSGRLSKLIP